MSKKALQDYVFTSKYSRYIPEKQRRETFDEAVDRVMDMHRQHFEGLGLHVADLIKTAGDAMHERLILGSQRAMQFGGQPILRKNARLYNCTTSYCDRARFFQEALWLLLCGAGVGFSVQRHHIAKLPAVTRPLGGEMMFQIPDTIEGWADALGVLLSSYFVKSQPFPEYAGRLVRFDYSLIRPKGSAISSGMGRAPGAEPLKRSLEKIRELLEKRVSTGTVQLRPIDAYDLMMHASDAVLSGGVRRSATICLFSPDDIEMATAKTGNWFIENPQRARSNNSAILLRSSTSRNQFAKLMKSVREFGEPGFIWTDDLEATFNPCVEIGLYPQIDGVSGFAFCNLCEINMGNIDSREKFLRAAEAAAILGTLQADYTSFDYLGETSEKIARRESLLGVSMTGMMEHPSIAFDPELQRAAAKRVLDVNEKVAKRLGLNPCARATCVKPAGTTSCILGTSSGIHPHHSRRYFRRAQASDDELLVDFYKAQNPLSVEKSVWNPNGTDVVLSFCIEAGNEAVVKSDVTAVQLLEYVKLTKMNWVDSGKRPELCAKPWLSHNVSNTISVKDSEWPAVEEYIYENRSHFAGVSLLPDGGDLDYPQAPFCEVLTAQEIINAYGTGALFASGLIVDGLAAFDNNLWSACDAALGRSAENFNEEFKAPSGTHPKIAAVMKDVFNSKRDWIRRLRKFADNNFDGDILKATRCLKRVNNCKLWEDINRDSHPVDYTQMHETQDNTTITQTIACAGGTCDILAK